MLNFGFTSLASLTLVYLNIIVLDEEILILICFITFNWIAFNRLGENIFSSLKNQASILENIITNSLNSLLDKLLLAIQLKKKVKNLSIDFQALKNRFIKLSSVVLSKFPDHLAQKLNSAYPKRLQYVWRFEEQTVKLLALLLNKKLDKLISTQKFFTNNLKVVNFIRINKITLRERFKTI
uniref:ATP synthase F0 subunit b n=1 Tax=Catenella fusiformis TaxID=3024791 RepID=UPI0030020915|nr:ATP synthase F0 subunit b [Catenella fusiformis]